MIKQVLRVHFTWESSIPWGVLGMLLIYTFGELFYAPYVGFNFARATSEVNPVFVENPAAAMLQAGDRLQQVGSVTWSAYVTDLRQPLFAPLATGQILPIRIDRHGEILTVPWRIPGPTFWDIIDRVVNLWWLAYVFWVAGTATYLLVRPKDQRWWLLMAFYFLTAIWLVAGNTSRWHLWHSAIMLRIAIWLSVPVYLHLHWVFPRPLGEISPIIWWGAYMISIALAGLQWMQRLPSSAYLAGFMLAIGGSALLLIAHFIYQPQERREIRVLVAAMAFAVVPAIGLSIAQLYQVLPWFGPVVLLTLPLIPGAYFYTTYRHQLGGLELRTNRLIVFYLFFILLGTGITMLVTFAHFLPEFTGKSIFISVAGALLSILITAFGFGLFQRLIEYRLLGIPMPPRYLVERYAARITTSLNRASLVRVLRDEVLPSLSVRQSALLSLDDDRQFTCLYRQEVDQPQLPRQFDLSALLATPEIVGATTLKDSLCQTYPWIRLALTLQVSHQLIGLWLWGRRDPDDFYSQTEMATFQALADQTAIALTNINQATHLRAVYQANIDRHELERTHLAHELHDEVLHHLAVLALHVEESKASPYFDQAYQTLTRRIRQIITGLRPVMINYGLHAALEEFVEDLAERADQQVTIQVDLPETQVRYAARVEEYVFRIVQQAGENALRHAHAQSICVRGRLEPAHLQLIVSDDGCGFPDGQLLDVPTLLAHEHFGVVGMFERATLIGADLRIESLPGLGTDVIISWPSRESVPGKDSEFVARVT